jgi:hypothetical protein
VGGAPQPAAAAPPPAAPPVELKRKDAPAAPADRRERQLERTDRIDGGGNEAGQQSQYAGPGGADSSRDADLRQEALKPPAAAALAKAAGASPLWETPSSRPVALRTSPGAASYDTARRSLAAGRLPDPAAVRTGEILNAFEAGGAPPVEGAPTPFVHGPGYRLLRIHPSPPGPAEVSFNPAAVVRYRRVGAGLAALYEIELRSDAPPDAQVATLRLGGIERAVLSSELSPSWDKASPGFRLAALAAELAEALKGGPGHPAEIARLAREAGKTLPESAKATELAELAERVAEVRGRQ